MKGFRVPNVVVQGVSYYFGSIPGLPITYSFVVLIPK